MTAADDAGGFVDCEVTTPTTSQTASGTTSPTTSTTPTSSQTTTATSTVTSSPTTTTTATSTRTTTATTSPTTTPTTTTTATSSRTSTVTTSATTTPTTTTTQTTTLTTTTTATTSQTTTPTSTPYLPQMECIQKYGTTFLGGDGCLRDAIYINRILDSCIANQGYATGKVACVDDGGDLILGWDTASGHDCATTAAALIDVVREFTGPAVQRVEDFSCTQIGDSFTDETECGETKDLLRRVIAGYVDHSFRVCEVTTPTTSATTSPTSTATT
eukprot:gene28797-31877_t